LELLCQRFLGTTWIDEVELTRNGSRALVEAAG
jgi:hypothetical protein